MGHYEYPTPSLHYPNRKTIGYLGFVQDFGVQLKFNNLSTISLQVPYQVYQDGKLEKTPYYEEFRMMNKIHLPTIGWFTIGDVQEKGDGIKKYKIVPAQAEECFLAKKYISEVNGTFKFWDMANPDKTMMKMIMGYLPGWNIGTIDASLLTKYRTFDINSKMTVYTFIMNKVAKAYECFFLFDTETKTQNVRDVEHIVKNAPIYLRYDNLIHEVTLKSKSDEYVTALAVTGGDDLDIRSVNPIGGTYLYNFDYAMTTGQMSEGLVQAITAWNERIDSNQNRYATLLTEYKNLNSEMVRIDSDLRAIQTELDAAERVMQVNIDAGKTDLSEDRQKIREITRRKTEKETEKDAKQGAIDACRTKISDITDELAMENNFTTDLIGELSQHIVESSYQNENIIKTSSMSNAEIQEQAQELYEIGKHVQTQLSQPRYAITADSANFLFLKQYEKFGETLELGSTLHLQINDSFVVKPVLLGIKFNYNKPTEFSQDFGNRYRLDDEAYSFTELIEDAVSSGNSIAANSTMWNDWYKNHRESVNSFIQSPQDASKNAVINSVNQEVTLSSVGLRGRKYNPSINGYEDEQIWMTNNTLAFTDDQWNTVKTALGKIRLPDGSQAYGLAGEVIMGELVAGSALQIRNKNNKFLVDEKGATLVDASFTMTTANDAARVTINPSTGFRVQAKESGGWTDKIYLDANGNATFAGKIISASGTIGGINIGAGSLYSTTRDSSGKPQIELKSDGTGRLGFLTWDRTKATFNGSIQAKDGAVGGWRIKQDGLYSSNGTDKILADGYVKLGNGVLTMDGGDAVFSGGIYASNLRDYVQSGNIGNNAVTSPKIRNSSITKEKLEDAIKAVLADLENLYAEVMTSKLMSLKYMYYAGATTSNAFYGVKWKYDSSIGYYLGR